MYDDLENLFLNLNELKHNVEKWKIVLYKNKIQMKETDDLNKLNEIIENKIKNKCYLSLHEMSYSRKKKLIDMFIRKGFVKKVNEFQSNEHRLNVLLNILKFLYDKDSFEISLVVQEKEG
jgi:F0F1-type ATP synthase delta subunit